MHDLDVLTRLLRELLRGRSRQNELVKVTQANRRSEREEGPVLYPLPN